MAKKFLVELPDEYTVSLDYKNKSYEPTNLPVTAENLKKQLQKSVLLDNDVYLMHPSDSIKVTEITDLNSEEKDHKWAPGCHGGNTGEYS